MHTREPETRLGSSPSSRHMSVVPVSTATLHTAVQLLAGRSSAHSPYAKRYGCPTQRGLGAADARCR